MQIYLFLKYIIEIKDQLNFKLFAAYSRYDKLYLTVPVTLFDITIHVN